MPKKITQPAHGRGAPLHGSPTKKKSTARKPAAGKPRVLDQNGKLQFKMDPQEDDDGEPCEEEYPGMTRFSATFSKGARGPKGRISALLIDRDGLQGYSFHDVCDSESSDLQRVSTQFCDRQGRLRIDVGDPSANRGGFLYISDLQVPAEYRNAGSTEVSADVIQQFVQHAGPWTLTVYVPECEGWRDHRPGGHERGSAEHKAFLHAGCAADMRAFFRAGFVQATTLDNRVYLTANARRLTHAEAMGVLVVQVVERPQPHRDMMDFRAVFGLGGFGDEMEDGLLDVGSMSHHQMQTALPAYNARNGTNFSGRPVTGSHRKECSECGHSFSEFGGEWYWTDFGSPWGADKFCDSCMAMHLGGDFGGGELPSDEDDY